MKKLERKIADVTGATKGIGASVAKHLAAKDVAIVAHYTSRKEAHYCGAVHYECK